MIYIKNKDIGKPFTFIHKMCFPYIRVRADEVKFIFFLLYACSVILLVSGLIQKTISTTSIVFTDSKINATDISYLLPYSVTEKEQTKKYSILYAYTMYADIRPYLHSTNIVLYIVSFKSPRSRQLIQIGMIFSVIFELVVSAAGGIFFLACRQFVICGSRNGLVDKNIPSLEYVVTLIVNIIFLVFGIIIVALTCIVDRPIDDLIIDEGILMRNGNGDKVSRQKTYSRVSNRENNRYVNEFDMDSD
jgi:hypothetical protein